MALWQWSKTPTSNGTSDPTMNWSEGIAPSIVDDNVRAEMARIAEYRDDISGSLTTGGTSTAYTLTTNQVLATPTPTTGQLIALVPNATNGASATLSCDGGSAYPIQTSPGIGIGAGVLVQGTPYTMTFNGSAWMVRDLYGGSPFIVPLGGLLHSTVTTPPNSSFVLPFGQAISRTTYAVYFAAVGTTYGAGDGSTTFNVIDVRGCALVPLDNLGGTPANRIGTGLVTDGGTINGQVLGSFGGSQSHVQTNAELNSHTHANSLTDLGHTHTVQGNSLGGTGGSFIVATNFVGTQGTQATGSNNSTPMSITNASQGSSNAMAWLQPSRMCSCFLRVI
jgi:microcystin-dependent protein